MSFLPSEPRPLDLQLNENEFCETVGDVDDFEDMFGEMDNWEALFGNFLDDEVVAGFWPPTPEVLAVHRLPDPESVEPLSLQSPSKASPEISDSGALAASNVPVETFGSMDNSPSQLGNLNRSLSLPNTSHIPSQRSPNPTSFSLKSGSFTNTRPHLAGGRLSLPTISVPKLLPNDETPQDRGGRIENLNKPAQDNASQHQIRRRSSGKTDGDSLSPEFKKR